MATRLVALAQALIELPEFTVTLAIRGPIPSDDLRSAEPGQVERGPPVKPVAAAVSTARCQG
jgi:hypothetical protein